MRDISARIALNLIEKAELDKREADPQKVVHKGAREANEKELADLHREGDDLLRKAGRELETPTRKAILERHLTTELGTSILKQFVETDLIPRLDIAFYSALPPEV
jgi:hypothetical protein